MTNYIFVLYSRYINQPKGKNMTTKIEKRYTNIDALSDLKYVGKTSVCNGGFDDERGKTMVTLLVQQRAKKAVDLEVDSIIADDCLKDLGFKAITKGGADDVIAFADIIVEYDIRKKPYTITRANVEELNSLTEVMDYTRARTYITRDEPKIERVLTQEFKQAVANYIKQNQK